MKPTKVFIPVSVPEVDPTQALIAKFWMKVEHGEGCWIWKSALNETGYGVCSFGKKHELAHRVAFRIARGEFDQSLHVCHKCDNPKCVNPYHLFLGNSQINMTDKQIKGRGHKKGAIKSSKYLGVSFRKDNLKWKSYVIWQSKYTNVGNYQYELDAARAHDDYIITNKLPLQLNFPQ